MTISNTIPVFAVPDENLLPVSDCLSRMMDIPPSRMFLTNNHSRFIRKNIPTHRYLTPRKVTGCLLVLSAEVRPGACS